MSRKCNSCGFMPPLDSPSVDDCPQCGKAYPVWGASASPGSGKNIPSKPIPASQPKDKGFKILEQERILEGYQRFTVPVAEWCAGRTWVWRALLLAYLGFEAYHFTVSPQTMSIFNGINLGIHELGHVVMFRELFGQYLNFAAGTLFQVAAPIIGGIMFYRQRDYFAISVAGVWLATNLYYVAWYMSTAGSKQVQLVAPWANPKHDWTYLFGRFGIVPQGKKFAVVVRWGAHLVMWASIIAALWMIWVMMTKRAEVREQRLEGRG